MYTRELRGHYHLLEIKIRPFLDFFKELSGSSYDKKQFCIITR